MNSKKTLPFTLYAIPFQKGYIALTSVLVIIAVIVAAALTVTYLAIGEGQSGLALFKGEENLAFVEGCVEDGMLKARSDVNFGNPVGTEVIINRPEGACSVTVASKVGVTWTMNVTTSGASVPYKRTIVVIFDRNPTGITLTSWKEI